MAAGGVNAGIFSQGGVEGLEQEFELFPGDGKGGHDDDGVQDRAGEQAVAAGGLAEGFAGAEVGRKLFSIGLAEFHAEGESDSAHVVDLWVFGLEL